MDEEKELLLSNDKNLQPYQIRRRNWLDYISKHPILCIYFLLLHILLFVSIFENIASSEPSIRVIFPELRTLRRIIKAEHATNHTAYSNYSGPPNEANAAAWTHLLQPLYFNASTEELLAGGASPDASVQVKDGGFVAALGVYHEIHCLNKLRYFLYTRDMTDSQHEMWEDHLDHCIEVLRISVMCTADTSLYTFTWPQDSKARFLDAHSASPRKCADWEQLETYAWGRKIGLAPTLLKFVEDGNTTSEVVD